jgi:hypothetical protein
MKKLILIAAVLGLLVSCGQQDDDTSRDYNFQQQSQWNQQGTFNNQQTGGTQATQQQIQQMCQQYQGWYPAQYTNNQCTNGLPPLQSNGSWCRCY